MPKIIAQEYFVMGIKIRIILMIIGIMVLVAVSTDFLSTTLNNKNFQ